MKKSAFLFAAILFLFATRSFCYGSLNLVRQIELPNVTGRLDHMAVDLKRQELFVAAYGNNSLEIIDLRRGRLVRSVKGLDGPQGVEYIPGKELIAVSNGVDGTLLFFKADTLKLGPSISEGMRTI